MDRERLIDDALHEPAQAISYRLHRWLRGLFPDRALLEGNDQTFNLEGYGRAGHCLLEENALPLSQHLTYWLGSGGALHRAQQAWFAVDWRGECLDVLVMHWNDNMSSPYHYFILADQMATAERFLGAVCDWQMELRDEILVFEGGGWHKDQELFSAIKNATLDNLVLRGTLKEDVYADLAGFFASRETYETYGVPWKRGILLLGPPGNGKTHAVKALVNALARPCLYVKSFHAQLPDEYSIRAVFDRARAAAPCVLVLEDLDSLVTPTNRSFFLNELDGFAGNTGILTLATTNHPERLDPAILDRPSRFDRKYPFDLPALEERRTYIARWNETLKPALRLSEGAVTAIAEGTDGFSFAYLKELFIAATMRWIATQQEGAMDAIMGEQVDVLREQMASVMPLVDAPGDEAGMPVPPMYAMHRRMGWGSPAHIVMQSGMDEGDVPL